jgi:hypothetical protein
VIAKGLPADRITRAESGTLLAEIQAYAPHVTKVKVEPVRAPTAKFTTIVLHLRSADAATRLCERGLIWQAQIFNCEPYSADLRIRRCFQCHQFGHIGRFCKNQARCGHCAGAAHPRGEKECPQLNGRKRCVNCSGPHAAWDRQCPKALEAKERAQAAYQQRPRQFEVSTSSFTSRVPSVTPASSQDSDDGYQIVAPKRLRTGNNKKPTAKTPARRGRPPIGALDTVTVRSHDITEMLSQGTNRGSSDPFATQDSQIQDSQQ